MAVSGRHCIFFEADDTRVLVVRILHDRMDYRRHLGVVAGPDVDAERHSWTPSEHHLHVGFKAQTAEAA